MRKKQQIKKLTRDVEILKVRLAALEARPGAVAPPPFPAGPPGMPADYQQLQEQQGQSPLPAVDMDALRNIANYGVRYG